MTRPRVERCVNVGGSGRVCGYTVITPVDQLSSPLQKQCPLCKGRKWKVTPPDGPIPRRAA